MSQQVRNNKRSIFMSQIPSYISQLRNSSIKSQVQVKNEEVDPIDVMGSSQEGKQQNHVTEVEGYNHMEQLSRPQMIAQAKREKEEDLTDGMEVIDLNRYLFNGIVQFCHREGLICEEVAHDFLTNHSIGIDKDFILKYRNNELNKFDFSKCKINLFDYRKLVQMLVQHNPEKYVLLSKPDKTYDFRRETHQFLKQIYQMSDIDFQRERDEQIIKYCQHWWGGPEKVDPLIEPPLKFYETEQGQKSRIEKETAIRIQTEEQAKDRNKRIRDQRTTNDDLKTIGLQMIQKLYGDKVDVKLESNASEEQANSKDIYDESASAPRLKSKKQNKDKKEKKSKKEKSKKIKKEKKKGNEDAQLKYEDEDYRPGADK